MMPNTVVRSLKSMAVVVGVGGALAPVWPAHAAVPGVLRTLKIYSAEADGVGVTENLQDVLTKIGQDHLAKPGNFELKAKISIIRDNSSAAYDVLDLGWNPPTSVFDATRGAGSPGWNRMGGGFTWIPGGVATSLQIPFGGRMARSHDGVVMADYDELRVDYREMFPRQLCAIAVRMAMGPRKATVGDAGVLVAVAGDRVLRGLSEISVAEADFVSKDAAYRLGRLLDGPHDDKWRYTAWRGLTVMQRRLNQDLSGLEALDLIFASGVSVEGLNLRIGTSGHSWSKQLIELGRPPGMGVVGGSNQLWRVDLPRIFAAQSSGKERIYLKEIIVFVKGGDAVSSGGRPLRKIVFQGLGTVEDQEAARKADVAVLPIRTEVLPSSVKRVSVDLRDLRRRGAGYFKGGRIIIPVPGATHMPGGVIIEKIQLVRARAVESPVFLSAGEALNRRWGGPFLSPTDRGEAVEWPVVLEYFHFASLGPRLAAAGKSISGHRLLALFLKKVGLSLPERAPPSEPEEDEFPVEPFTLQDRDMVEVDPDELNDETSSPIQTWSSRSSLLLQHGVSLRSNRPLTQAVSKEDGLEMEGSGRWIEVSWPASAVVMKNAMVFLAVPEGDRQIQKIVLTASFESGPDLSLVLKPNRPEPLFREGKIKVLRVKIYMARAHFRIKLKEAVIFRPALLAQAEAFVQKLPVPVSFRPVPSALSVPPGVIVYQDRDALRGVASDTGGPGGGILKWTTSLPNPMKWARQLRFNYVIPAGTLAANPCPIHVTLRWDQKTASKVVCLKQETGVIFLPVADFLGGSDPGSLRSTDWEVHFGTLSSRLDNSFEFDASFEGSAMQSISDELTNWSVLESGGLPLGFTVRKDSAEEILRGPIWVTAGAGAMSQMRRSGIVVPVASPWFRVNAAVIAPTPSAPDDIWDTVVSHKAGLTSGTSRLRSRVQDIIFLLGLGFLFWIGVGRMRRRALVAVHQALLAASWAAIMIGRGCGAALDHAASFNIAVACFAGGVGFWHSGTYGWTQRGIAELAAWLIVIGGAYWHRLCGSHRNHSAKLLAGDMEIPSFLLRSAGAAVVLWTGWTVGSFKHNPEAKWNLLPVLALGYFFIPWIYSRGSVMFWPAMRRIRPNPTAIAAIFWSSATFLLYATGVKRLPGSGPNHYFLFGGAASVFALRFVLGTLRPILKSCFPTTVERLFSGAGKPYFACAILAMTVTAVGLMAQVQFLTEQSAIVAFDCIIIGIIVEVIASAE